MALLSLSTTVAPLRAQQPTPEINIPNGDFEGWEAGLPTGWGGLNIPGYETFTQSEDAKSGSLALQGVTLPAIFGEGTMPCILVSANPDPNDPESFIPGFAYSGRPASMTGYIKTDLKPNDTVTIVAAFMRGEDSVGGGLIQIAQNHSGWTKFTVPFQYYNDVLPDTAAVAILMGSENAAPGSKFWIDDLSFSQEVADVEYENRAASLEVTYGGNRYITATFHNREAMQTTLEVVDVNGRTVEVLHNGLAGSASARWSTERVPSGVYLVKLTRPTGIVTKKVFVAR